MNYSIWFTEATRRVAEQADQLLRSTGCATHYLYYKPRGLEFRVLCEDSTHEGLELVVGEKVPGHLTLEQLTSWVRQHASSCPVLPGN